MDTDKEKILDDLKYEIYDLSRQTGDLQYNVQLFNENLEDLRKLLNTLLRERGHLEKLIEKIDEHDTWTLRRIGNLEYELSKEKDWRYLETRVRYLKRKETGIKEFTLRINTDNWKGFIEIIGNMLLSALWFLMIGLSAVIFLEIYTFFRSIF